MTDTSEVATVSAANAKAAPTAPASPAAELPPTFEIALQNMLQAFGDGRDPSLSAIAGAALLLLQKAEQSLATIAGTATDEAKNGFVVKLPLDPDLQAELVSGLNAMKAAIAAKERDVAGLRQQWNAFEDANQALRAETENRMARTDEHLEHLRARHDALVSGATELSETVQELEATIQRDHRKLTEEFIALGRRIESLETTKRTK